MGNCLNPASKQRHGGLLPEEEESLSEMRRISQLLREEEEDDAAMAEYNLPEETAADVLEAAPATVAAEGLKVKIVLTRSELEWLMAQLKSGEQRLEDVLHHMQAAKAAAAAVAEKPHAAWRPRLESILECPETTATLVS
ncbi:hypothetical protein HU200_052506 [Digitaria exilis]|uniref:Uncharacterized protein n=1 Tax=Digitaria exilis TaxID=1010633 RepID=A0A835E5U0_9POAL|nr:hypothetical protein HU200_052506 [Digitaria exilis]